MEKKLNALQYIKEQLYQGQPAVAFMADWNTLSDKDKSDMKAWATKEMEVLGLL